LERVVEEKILALKSLYHETACFVTISSHHDGDAREGLGKKERLVPGFIHVEKRASPLGDNSDPSPTPPVASAHDADPEPTIREPPSQVGDDNGLSRPPEREIPYPDDRRREATPLEPPATVKPAADGEDPTVSHGRNTKERSEGKSTLEPALFEPLSHLIHDSWHAGIILTSFLQ
jgi:hypothetical protein